MVKNLVNKRRIFIILIGIITVFVLYLVIRGERPIVTNAPEEVIPNENTDSN